MWNDKESSGDVIIEEKTENPDEIVVTRMTNNDPKPNSFTDDLATSAKANPSAKPLKRHCRRATMWLWFASMTNL